MISSTSWARIARNLTPAPATKRCSKSAARSRTLQLAKCSTQASDHSGASGVGLSQAIVPPITFPVILQNQFPQQILRNGDPGRNRSLASVEVLEFGKP